MAFLVGATACTAIALAAGVADEALTGGDAKDGEADIEVLEGEDEDGSDEARAEVADTDADKLGALLLFNATEDEGPGEEDCYQRMKMN